MPATSLSQELICLIISHLGAPSVYNRNRLVFSPGAASSHATVSKEWQAEIESHTFSKLRLNFDRLAEFKDIVRGQRRGFVCCIDFDVVLDPYDEKACGKIENSEDQARNNQIFTRDMQTLFDILSSWHSIKVAKSGIALQLLVYSPSDISRTQGEKFETRYQGARLGRFKDLKDRRFEQSYLRLLQQDSENASGLMLKSAPAITEFQLNDDCRRHIWPADFSAVIGRLPRLRCLNACLFDNEKRKLDLRKSARSRM